MKLVREGLYNFHKTGDVKGGLYIGIKAKIKIWLDEMGVKNYTINEDGTINVKGKVNLIKKNLTKFPTFIRFRKVGGGFYCSENNLTSLEGAPQEVGGDFSCAGNNLISLKGAPQKVQRNFDCSRNELTSLEGSPPETGGYFKCYLNKLISLEGAPKEVGWDFDCCYNSRKFTEEEVIQICNVKGKIYVR